MPDSNSSASAQSHRLGAEAAALRGGRQRKADFRHPRALPVEANANVADERIRRLVGHGNLEPRRQAPNGAAAISARKAAAPASSVALQPW